MSKSWLQSQIVLRRFTNNVAPIIPETWVGLLTVMPTASNPTGWVEWREAENTPIDRIRIFQGDEEPLIPPYWSNPESEGNTYETHNVGGVRWSSVQTTPLATGSQTIVGVGIFTSESTTYSDGEPENLTQLIYWNTLTNSLTVTQGESVTFLTGKIKVTES